MRHFIGKKTFWSNSDGDWDRRRQTVYRIDSAGSARRISGRAYDPTKGKWKRT